MDYFLTEQSLEEDRNITLNGTQDDPDLPVRKILIILIFCLLILVTFFGNTLIIIAVITTRRLRTVTNCFIMSLAVADWLVGVFVMPFAVAYYFTESWEWGWLLCNLWVSSDVCLCTASILSLCAISIDRYLSITQPLGYWKKHRSKGLASLMILIVWLVSIVITCPPMFGWYDIKTQNRTCTYNENTVYVVVSAMVSFFVPLAIMMYVYSKIVCVIFKRSKTFPAGNQPTQKKTKKIKSKETDDSDRSERISSEGEEQKSSRRQSKINNVVRVCNSIQCSNSIKMSSLKAEHKTIKTLTIVVGGFTICWLPFFCSYLLKPFITSSIISSWFPWLTWLGYLNSAINPFIYAFYNPDFRSALWRLTLKRCATKKQGTRMLRRRTLRQSLYVRGRV